MSEKLGSGPIAEEYKTHMLALAQAIDELLNGENPTKRGTGFVLMVFPFGQPDEQHRCNYVSNADRKDIVALLKEQLAYFQGMPDTPPSERPS